MRRPTPPSSTSSLQSPGMGPAVSARTHRLEEADTLATPLPVTLPGSLGSSLHSPCPGPSDIHQDINRCQPNPRSVYFSLSDSQTPKIPKNLGLEKFRHYFYIGFTLSDKNGKCSSCFDFYFIFIKLWHNLAQLLFFKVPPPTQWVGLRRSTRSTAWLDFFRTSGRGV